MQLMDIFIKDLVGKEHLYEILNVLTLDGLKNHIKLNGISGDM